MEKNPKSVENQKCDLCSGEIERPCEIEIGVEDENETITLEICQNCAHLIATNGLEEITNGV